MKPIELGLIGYRIDKYKKKRLLNEGELLYNIAQYQIE